INWREGFRGCPAHAIRISYGERPREMALEALAYALPFERTHIQVYYNDVTIRFPKHAPTVLAHVMVHELTHILQGLSRHSDSGIMKARWTQSDFNSMLTQPLPFTAEDVSLIYNGLAVRSRALAVAGDVPME